MLDPGKKDVIKDRLHRSVYGMNARRHHPFRLEKHVRVHQGKYGQVRRNYILKNDLTMLVVSCGTAHFCHTHCLLLHKQWFYFLATCELCDNHIVYGKWLLTQAEIEIKKAGWSLESLSVSGNNPKSSFTVITYQMSGWIVGTFWRLRIDSKAT